MKAVRAVVMCCALAIGGVSPARAAISDYLGKPVATVVFVIEGRDTTDPSLSDVIETRVGMPLSMAECARPSSTSIASGGSTMCAWTRR